uniref:Uncharacterized protein n=1 Tax=Tanacetum cinerariifolium TaxID=118510 RepID=A0A699KZC5_TANCI|nr:hypothetical protein [Tanacetum cinerariifolium]
MTIVKRVIVKHASEFTERINTLRLPSALPKKMAGKQKKQPRIRFAVRTPPVNCKPVEKVLPCTSSVGSNDPDVILLGADDHDEEEEEVESARFVSKSCYEDDLTQDSRSYALSRPLYNRIR